MPVFEYSIIAYETHVFVLFFCPLVTQPSTQLSVSDAEVQPVISLI